MLLEDDGGGQRGLEAVRRAGADDATEGAQRFASLFLVVGQFVQPMLDVRRRSQARNDALFGRCERQPRRGDRLSARERGSL